MSTPPRQKAPTWEIKYLSHQRKRESSPDSVSPVGVDTSTLVHPSAGRCQVRPAELCRRCGCRLDQLHIGTDVDRHPACHTDPPATDDQHRRALFAVAATFPTARQLETP